ncbi:MAG: hypothetical protein GX416_13975 [Bacteroidales bacterium]|nr:hypothetical protein [Bacteroidales bacterium]
MGFSSKSQNNPSAKVTVNNLFDNNGLKTGLWIENKGLVEVYYKNNLKDGVFRSYNRKNGKLSCFGEYVNGFRTGNWFYFNEKSQLVMIEKNISVNTDKITTDDGKKIVPKFKSYVIIYYENGSIKEEGTALYDKDIEIDFFKIGIWKYYDKKGLILK